tara:strand:+ start:258 stop:1082 length:825 start_codon:yes stop_codon:yes gene_type:complete
MTSLSKFFEDKEKILNVIQNVTIDLKDPNLTYSDWKLITDNNSSTHFKHPITGNIRTKKFQKNAWEKHIHSLYTKKETEEFIKEILKDETLPMKQCKDCKKWFPKILKYNGKKVSFWVKNGNNLRARCGEWGSNCDATLDRERKITSKNPTGIRKGGASDWSERMKHKDKILKLLVSAKKTEDKRKGLVSDLPLDWAIKKFEEQNGCCARTGFQFDFTHYTAEQGKNIFKPSINRIDNSKPHTVENCELVLMFINLGCSNAPKELVEKAIKLFK